MLDDRAPQDLLCRCLLYRQWPSWHNLGLQCFIPATSSSMAAALAWQHGLMPKLNMLYRCVGAARDVCAGVRAALPAPQGGEVELHSGGHRQQHRLQPPGGQPHRGGGCGHLPPGEHLLTKSQGWERAHAFFLCLCQGQT